MIGYLEGTPFELKTNSVIVLVSGVGYKVRISLNTYSFLRNQANVKLYIHTYVKEDRIELYGFHDSAELQAFEILIRINGVGTNVAMAILSGLSVGELSSAVQSRDYKKLIKIPGIGKTKAEKILLDLQNKFKGDFVSEKDDEKNQTVKDAVESMVALGFDEKAAEKTVKEIFSGNNDYTVEDLIRKSLSKIKK